MKNKKIKKNLKKYPASFLAIPAIAAVSASTAALMTPVSAYASVLQTDRVSVHDPSIVKADGKYYLFGSHMSNAVSSDLTSWKPAETNINYDYKNIFSKSGNWSSKGSSNYDISGNLWAPDVIYNETMGKWCMYMSVNGDNFYSSIALATADNIDGPYEYQGTVVYSGFTNSWEASETDYAKVTGTNEVDGRYLANGRWNSSYGTNAIDPCVTYDKNGDLWMSYGSWFGGIYLLKLDKNTGLRDYSHTYDTVYNRSDAYMGTKISGGAGTTGEGSYIVWDEESGYYYLYESYGGLNATDNFSGYNIRMFRSKNIEGPYLDAAGNSAKCRNASEDKNSKGIKLFGNYSFSSLNGAASGDLSSSGYKSGGHNSAIIDDDRQRYLVYHTRFNTGNEFHQVRVHQQFLNEDKWPVTAVYENLGSKISETGYSQDDMTGTYEFINHGNDASTGNIGMLNTNKVKLNDDGTISGDVTGKWTSKNGTYYCTMEINGVTYKGVFFKQYDESQEHKETMTFSLIGSNNQSIWGSKVSEETDNKNNSSNQNQQGENIPEGKYRIKNLSSGLYLDVTDGNAQNGTNVQQWTGNNNWGPYNIWNIKSTGDGYYQIYSTIGNGEYLLDLDYGRTENGTNIQIYQNTDCDAQKFKFVKGDNGSYIIYTKASNDTSCLDVAARSGNNGANVQEWEYNGGWNQMWILEKAESNDHSSWIPSGNDTAGNNSSGKYVIEAESGHKDGVSNETSRNGFSGNGYVSGFDNNNDSLEITVNVSKEGDYYLNTQYASEYGDKYTGLTVNGQWYGEKCLKQSSVFTDAYLDTVHLKAGENKIRLSSAWGWYDIDSFTLTKK